MLDPSHIPIKLPDKSRVDLFSMSTFGTIIITLQGALALYPVVVKFPDWEAQLGNPISMCFNPLAVFGLCRLLASPWLTGDFVYAEPKEGHELDPILGTRFRGCSDPSSDDPFDCASILAISNDQLDREADGNPCPHFHPQSSWRGILVRALFSGFSLFVLGAHSFTFKRACRGSTPTSLAVFASLLFYLILLITSFVTVFFYILTTKVNTTVIPCIQSTWYKVYSSGIFLLAIALIVISGLETRRTECGLYTTFPIDLERDKALCQSYKG
jgi:hypothetical protein